jgi:hypothetical protein
MTRSTAKRLLDTPDYQRLAVELNRLPCNSADLKAKRKANVALVVRRRASEGCSDTVLVDTFARRCRAGSNSTAKNMDRNMASNSPTQNIAPSKVVWIAKLLVALPNGATTWLLPR